MTYSMTCRAEFRTDGNAALTASMDFTEWVRSLPADATLSPITWEKGTQRDPWPVLVGLRASWTEER